MMADWQEVKSELFILALLPALTTELSRRMTATHHGKIKAGENKCRLMLQLIIIFYGPGLWLKHNIWSGDEMGRMMATVVAFTINYACYFSVIFRGGIKGVPAGQREAGEVLGMTKSQIFFTITLLQMVKRIVPPMSNEIITLVKDTSLARIIAAYELTFADIGRAHV